MNLNHRNKRFAHIGTCIKRVQTFAVAVLALMVPQLVQAADFQCFNGDTQCLINNINAANALADRARAHRIFLHPGAPYIVDQVSDVSGPFGLTGLPPISTDLQIIGVRASPTPSSPLGDQPPAIVRPSGSANMRFLLVSPEGSLHLENLILENGRAVSDNCNGIEPRGAGGALLVVSRSKEEAQRRANSRDPNSVEEVNARGDITIDGVHLFRELGELWGWCHLHDRHTDRRTTTKNTKCQTTACHEERLFLKQRARPGISDISWRAPTRFRWRHRKAWRPGAH